MSMLKRTKRLAAIVGALACAAPVATAAAQAPAPANPATGWFQQMQCWPYQYSLGPLGPLGPYGSLGPLKDKPHPACWGQSPSFQ